ncbi:MAG: hypothetical protein V7K18_13180 [Nostoc sp.]|uniref:hypothetical protein n=1 Tax=Nostoc sp. TaxID=1180 RepID=UPI002FFAFB2D
MFSRKGVNEEAGSDAQSLPNAALSVGVACTTLRNALASKISVGVRHGSTALTSCLVTTTGIRTSPDGDTARTQEAGEKPYT